MQSAIYAGMVVASGAVRTADSHVAVKLLATLWDLAINVLLLSVNEIQVDFNAS